MHRTSFLMWQAMEMLVHMLMCEIMGLYIDKSVRIVRLHLHEPVECENTYEIIRRHDRM